MTLSSTHVYVCNSVKPRVTRCTFKSSDCMTHVLSPYAMANPSRVSMAAVMVGAGGALSRDTLIATKQTLSFHPALVCM